MAVALDGAIREQKLWEDKVSALTQELENARACLSAVKGKVERLKKDVEKAKADEEAKAKEASKPPALKALNALGRWMVSHLVKGEFEGIDIDEMSDLKYKQYQSKSGSWFHYPFSELPPECSILIGYGGSFNEMMDYRTQMSSTNKVIQLHQYATGWIDEWRVPYALVRDFQEEFGKYLIQLDTLEKSDKDGKTMVNVYPNKEDMYNYKVAHLMDVEGGKEYHEYRERKKKEDAEEKAREEAEEKERYEKAKAKEEAKAKRVLKVKKPEAPISIPKKEFVAEHKELVQVLKKDEPKAVAQEAKKQEAELSSTLKKDIEKHTNKEIADIIREHLKKHNKSVALSGKNKAQLLEIYKQIKAKYP